MYYTIINITFPFQDNGNSLTAPSFLTSKLLNQLDPRFDVQCIIQGYAVHSRGRSSFLHVRSNQGLI